MLTSKPSVVWSSHVLSPTPLRKLGKRWGSPIPIAISYAIDSSVDAKRQVIKQEVPLSRQLGRGQRVLGNRFPRSIGRSGLVRFGQRLLESERGLAGVMAASKSSATNDAAVATWKDKPEEVGGCLVHHRFLVNGDVQIHYVEAGDPQGELVVLLHGFPEFWYSWKSQLLPLVQAGFHVAAPDLRGYNLSLPPPNLSDYTRDKVLSDVVLLIDQLGGGKPANVAGHDWGGYVAWLLAFDHGDKVKRLAVLNIPHPISMQKYLRSSLRQMRYSWYIFMFQLPYVPEKLLGPGGQLKRLYSGIKKMSEEDVQKHLDVFLSRPDGLAGPLNYYRGGFRGNWERKPASSGAEYKGKEGYTDRPVFFIWGEEEAFFVPDLAVPPQDKVPNVKVLKIPGASHFVMWDAPDQVSAALVDFFTKEEKGGGGGKGGAGGGGGNMMSSL